jgi:signal transduction histidine kinase
MTYRSVVLAARAHARALRLDPVARDSVLALACAAALVICAGANDQGGRADLAACALALVACAPVALRTVNPIAALVGVSAGAYLALATFKPQAMVILPVGLVLYTVALTGTRVRTAIVAVVSFKLTVIAMAVFPAGHHSVFTMEVLEKVALVLLPLLVGEAVRMNCQFKREKAEQLERDADHRIEQERLRIAREVHDVVAHSMVAINVQAGVAAHLMDRRPEAARDALHDIKRVSGDALRDLRATLGVLRTGADEPVPTRPAPGLDGLDELAGRLRAAGIDVGVTVRGGGDGRALPSALEGAGFRIVQEALTNVLRHSGARTARVDVAVGPHGLAIEVVDDGAAEAVAVGAGAGSAPAGSGNGLRGMRERAAAVGGSLEAGPREGGGWRVAARLPLG